MAPTTRSQAAPKKPAAKRPPSRAALLRKLKLSPEVAWYLESRGIPLPTCPPAIKTPEPRNLPDARFDPARVDKVLASFGVLRHTQGSWAGTPLRPDPWQIAYLIAPVFGWVHANEHGRWVRIITKAYVDVPARNGKTTLAGGIAIYLTGADGEQGAQVIVGATTKDQAGFMFAPIKQLAESSPALKGHLIPRTFKILHPRSGSYFQAISSVADAQHGANLHGGLLDELHVHKTPELLDVIKKRTGSREQPLILITTTADTGAPGTAYARERDYIERLAKGVFEDPATYGVVFAADKTDDPFAEGTWRKANPGYGISPTKRYMEEQATEARNSPANLSTFLRINLGIRTKQVTKYIALDRWDASAGTTPIDETDLAGRQCHGGIDLSSNEDITAVCWDFPNDEDGTHDVVWRFWLPEDRLQDLERRTAGEASLWVAAGYLLLTPGNTIDTDHIKERVLADAELFDVQTIGFDRYRASELVRRLMDEGLTMVPVGQGTGSLSAPMNEIQRLVLKGQYHHGANPVMRWMIDNLAVAINAQGDVKPDKAHAAEKIDGVSAAATAMREVLDAKATEDEPPTAGYYGG
jgi:phage terminase large subunit-like protein